MFATIDTLRCTFLGATYNQLKDVENRWCSKGQNNEQFKNQYSILKLNETEKGYNGTIGLDFNPKQGFLNVTISSVPALLLGSSLKTPTLKDVESLDEAINHYISPLVDVDLNGAKITRIDNSIIIPTEHKVGRYISLLNDVTQSKQHHFTKKYYEFETLQLFNNTVLLGFYDKFENNKKKHYLTDLDEAPANLLRYEIQNKNSKSVIKAIGQVALKDLSTEKVARFLHRQRIKRFTTNFKLDTDTTKISTTELFNVMEHFVKEGISRQSVMNLALWYINLRKGSITIEQIKSAMQLSGYSRAAVSKKVKLFNNLLATDFERSSLFDEVKNKIHNYYAA